MDGSCLCATVKWRFAGALRPMANCHCSMCRKAHGTAYATYAGVDGDALEWLAGENAITRYESSLNFFRAFCRHCGSSVPGIAADGHAFIPAGCFDTEPGVASRVHIFTASKAPWYPITDTLRQFDGWPNDSAPTVDNPPRNHRVSNPQGRMTLKGSCLCASVVYEVTSAIDRVWGCHCKRCQKARAAAYAANGFTTVEGVHFTRGENHLQVYKLPGARFFTQVFCQTCGSPMPRKDTDRGLAIIPWGSLDTNPGHGVERHIFLGSKAAWEILIDDLPHHDGPQN